MQGKKKKKLAYDMRVREALEIRRHGSGPGKGLNEDNGAYLKTDIWDTVLNSIGKWMRSGCVGGGGGGQPFTGSLFYASSSSHSLSIVFGFLVNLMVYFLTVFLSFLS